MFLLTSISLPHKRRDVSDRYHHPLALCRQHERSGELINSRDANTISDIVRGRVAKLSPQLHNSVKVTEAPVASRAAEDQPLRLIHSVCVCRTSSDPPGDDLSLLAEEHKVQHDWSSTRSTVEFITPLRTARGEGRTDELQHFCPPLSLLLALQLFVFTL